MKNFLLLVIFLAIKTYSQQPKPIAESNYFVYNKYNYGYDIPNPEKDAMDSKGRFWIRPYTGKYRIVENAKIKEPYLPNVNSFPSIEKIFTRDGKDYLCTSGNIFVFKNDSLVQNIPLTEKLEEASNFVLHQNKIYYSINRYYNNTNKSKIYYYDFQKTHKFFEKNTLVGNVEPFKIKNQLYINSISDFTSTVFHVIDGKLTKIHSIKFTTDKDSYIRYKNNVKNYNVYYNQSKKLEEYQNYQLIKTTNFPQNSYFFRDQYLFSNSTQLKYKTFTQNLI